MSGKIRKTWKGTRLCGTDVRSGRTDVGVYIIRYQTDRKKISEKQLL